MQHNFIAGSRPSFHYPSYYPPPNYAAATYYYAHPPPFAPPVAPTLPLSTLPQQFYTAPPHMPVGWDSGADALLSDEHDSLAQSLAASERRAEEDRQLAEESRRLAAARLAEERRLEKARLDVEDALRATAARLSDERRRRREVEHEWRDAAAELETARDDAEAKHEKYRKRMREAAERAERAEKLARHERRLRRCVSAERDACRDERGPRLWRWGRSRSHGRRRHE